MSTEKRRDNLLDELSKRLGCEFISDMKYEPARTRAKAVLKEFSGDYTEQELAEAEKYLGG